MSIDNAQVSRRDFFGVAGLLGATMLGMTGREASAAESAEDRSKQICLIPDTYVAGTSYVPGIEALADGLCGSDELRLEREPENRFDCWAIRVLDAKGNKIGFIPRYQNEMIARLMDGGMHTCAKVKSVELIGTWFRIGIDVWCDNRF